MRRVALALLLTAGVASCSGRERGGETERAPLPPGVVARIGPELVHADTVARIARAEGVRLETARERAVSDALCAAGARSRLSADVVNHAERAALARELLSIVAEQAERQGPPSDAEIERLVRERWTEFDRPEAARTTHAVVIAEKPEQFGAARAVAERIAEAVRGALDSVDFSTRARAVPRGALTLRVEQLPPVTADGRTFRVEGSQAGAQFDVDFARAALALTTPGETSAPIKTKFGYHVIRLEERLPPQVVPGQERRRRLADEVKRRRADAARRELMARLGAELPIERSLAADELTARVPVAP